MTERPYDIEVSRVFDAPPGRVYHAFTDPDQFARLMDELKIIVPAVGRSI